MRFEFSRLFSIGGKRNESGKNPPLFLSASLYPLLWVRERNYLLFTFVVVIIIINVASAYPLGFALTICYCTSATTSVASFPLRCLRHHNCIISSFDSMLVSALESSYFHLVHGSNDKMKWNGLALVWETHVLSSYLYRHWRWNSLAHMGNASFFSFYFHLTYGSNGDIPPPQLILTVGLLRHYSF